jgi:hypothetical protein
MSSIGRRVVAWRGECSGMHGTVVRMDGIYHCFVRWDDGTESHYENAALGWEKFCK